jgi:thiol-disulfide isomerase/thioredoxin
MPATWISFERHYSDRFDRRGRAKTAWTLEPEVLTMKRRFFTRLSILTLGLGFGIASGALEPEIKLTPIKFDSFLKTIKDKNQDKYTLVDVWATWCGPCKENFPHLVEMHKKYSSKGLVAVSLSLDDPTKPKALAEALAFLKEKKAEFPNFVLDEEQADAFDKLNVNAIPAVLLFGPDGKEIKRFTLDDPNHQFTYDDVEKEIAKLLEKK